MPFQGRIFSKSSIPVLAFVALCLIGGTTWALQKTGLNNSLPLWSAGMRFLIAGTIIFLFQFLRRQFQLNKNLIKLALANGLFYFAVPFGTVYWASSHVPSGLVAVLASSISVYALLLNHFLRGKPASFRQILGVACAVIGIIIVFSNRLHIESNSIGILAMVSILFAMGSSAAITLKVQRHISELPFLNFVSLSMLCGGVLLLSASLILESGVRTFSSTSLYALLYLALIGSVLGFSLNILLLKHWHISKATSHLFISPVIALYIGYVFMDEIITTNVGIGTSIVILGVMLINFPPFRKGLKDVKC
ncbi:drug/metabolite transporter (DMT)-like permease [Pantoea sp. PNA 14-12]|uniref:DMT family transporter n=1 Tax=Pantoea TaxID=53335 RepID=UPI00092FC9E1|nr:MULTISPECIES: EamA family transporter [Pantoea]MEB6535377.1 EamA family transporter [Pantoea stewartii]PXV76572.1 drug/metabolite transporter (DMT)-like permease [Pantoea sp. PNA 03-3]TDS69220.1 drug/metabolite transporter (DMT)-like permease [Pantoea sp. PNA 14-12]